MYTVSDDMYRMFVLRFQQNADCILDRATSSKTPIEEIDLASIFSLACFARWRAIKNTVDTFQPLIRFWFRY